MQMKMHYSPYLCRLTSLLLAFTLAGCGAQVSNCKDYETPNGDVMFEADVFAASGAQKVYVYVQSSNQNLNFELGPVPPFRLTHFTEMKTNAEVNRYPIPPGIGYLSPITSCFAAAMRYPDGTYKQLYNPL